MDFRSVNTLNVRLNLLSGNLLPTINNNSEFSLRWKIYSGIVWLILLSESVLSIPGMMLVSKGKFLQDSAICIFITTEILIVTTRFYMYRNTVKQLIQKLNDLLYIQNEVMEKTVKAILQPIQLPLKLYFIGGFVSVLIWSALSYIVMFKKKYFLYEDFRVPIAFSREPFSTEIFLLGNTLALLSVMTMIVKKIALDTYTINLVILVTTQYRYIASQLVIIFQKATLHDKDYYQKHCSSNVDLWIEKEMRVLCQHQNTLIYIMSILKKILSLNFSVIYVFSVFRLCFVCVMLSEASLNFIEKFTIFMYLCGAVIQLYVMCFAVHQLLNATMEITDDTFHEEWYRFGPLFKRTFMLMIMSNKLPNSFSTFGKYNLTLPSFMTILNQAYSVALLFLRMK